VKAGLADIDFKMSSHVPNINQKYNFYQPMGGLIPNHQSVVINP
jgi:hypothetical protein